MWKKSLSIVLLFIGCMYLQPKQNRMSDLSQNDWANALVDHPEAIVLDVRTQEEFDEGHIPKALNIDLRLGPGFLDAINTLDKSKSYYVYCRSGARSAQAVQIMRDLGFSETYNLIGGILAWKGETVE